MLASPQTIRRRSLPGGFDAIIEPVQGSLNALTHFLKRQTSTFEEEIRDLVEYCLKNQGKRIRPVLVFLSGQTKPGTVSDDLVRAAAVIELVHLATLVHDDILDDATLRHNSDTVSTRWGATPAVLVGDALFSHALILASDFPTVAVCQAVSLATRRVCAGEIKQTFARGNAQFAMEDYFRVIELKTAELFRVSCRLGAQLAGYGKDCEQAAEIFGQHLGTAYQIYDDMADILGDEAKIGKTLGTDLASGKYTLPTLLLLQSGYGGASEAINPADSKHFDPAALAETLRITGVTTQVNSIFEAQITAAEEALAPVAERYPPADSLLSLSRFVSQLMSKLPL